MDRVERAVVELLRSYRTALQYTADMPMLGRSLAKSGGGYFYSWRRLSSTLLGSRFLTKVYAETHIRKQLEAIRTYLRLERLGASEEVKNKLTALDEQLAVHVQPMFRWRWLVTLVSRLPAVAATIPILTALSAWPLGEGVSFDTGRRALIALSVTVLMLWVVVVWPSLRLGFRVKRAIFAGGNDLVTPLFTTDTVVGWKGFGAPRFYDDPDHERRPRVPFPEIDVYQAETEVYRALGRRKPSEVPLDMLLSFTPYLLALYGGIFAWALIDIFASDDGDLFGLGLFVLNLAMCGAGLVVIGVLGTKNYRKRKH